MVFGIQAASGVAQGLTYLALFAVPPLAAVALGATARGSRPALALVVVPLFALAWLGRHGLAGEGAAVALSALSCLTLGALLGSVTPARALKAGIILMAVIDTGLVVSDLLAPPNQVLNAAHPAAGLPQLQRALFGSAVMGYGDLFVAGLLGALLAGRRQLQRRAALLALALGLAMNLLFLVVDELPATVPIALTLILLELRAPNKTVWHAHSARHSGGVLVPSRLRPRRARRRRAGASWPRARARPRRPARRGRHRPARA